jgi:pimeloyl-ACP methyl ester carboxylesterase
MESPKKETEVCNRSQKTARRTLTRIAFLKRNPRLLAQHARAAVVREYADLQVDQDALIKNQIPTLLIVGALDAEAQDAKVLQSLMPNSSLVEIEGVDHGGAYSHATLLSKTLQLFLDHKQSK